MLSQSTKKVVSCRVVSSQDGARSSSSWSLPYIHRALHDGKCVSSIITLLTTLHRALAGSNRMNRVIEHSQLTPHSRQGDQQVTHGSGDGECAGARGTINGLLQRYSARQGQQGGWKRPWRVTRLGRPAPAARCWPGINGRECCIFPNFFCLPQSILGSIRFSSCTRV